MVTCGIGKWAGDGDRPRIAKRHSTPFTFVGSDARVDDNFASRGLGAPDVATVGGCLTRHATLNEVVFGYRDGRLYTSI